MLQVDHTKRPSASTLLQMFPSSVSKLPSMPKLPDIHEAPKQVQKGFGSPT